ncbi:c-type cytochrome [Spartinivicinus poritis]|uniref:C-type cytochrome n=1 Tax=Spartinivicinus poritis TaxID=2994640 RepID=A0ABT5U4W3_9GAMM|nr:c-type cytochrome [Spartinivicinus sp. A2-2]MDE1461409.1 c-type cytochrome [Spartinivicinus sp. A2-2]
MIKLPVIALALLYIQSTSANNEQFNDLLKSKLSDPTALEKSLSSAKDKVFICTYCHGIDGNSQKEYIPNLASQNPEYTITQLINYSLNKRKSLTMNKISAELSLEDKVDIAIYYSKSDIRNKHKKESSLSSRGEKIFNTACFICHGKNAKGNKNIPSLAKQNEKYIKDTLLEFKNNKNYRPESPMFEIAAKLSRNDIQSIAAYISRISDEDS